MQGDFIKNCIKGFIASVVCGAVLILLFGVICNSMDDPKGLIDVFGFVALYAASFLGGFVSARSNKNNPLLSGVTTGAVFMLFIVVISLMVRGENNPTSFVSWLIFALIFAVATAGGYLGRPLSKKRKKRPRRR